MFGVKFWTMVGRVSAATATVVVTGLFTDKVTRAVGAGISTTAKKLFEKSDTKAAIKEGKDKAVKAATS